MKAIFFKTLSAGLLIPFYLLASCTIINNDWCPSCETPEPTEQPAPTSGPGWIKAIGGSENDIGVSLIIDDYLGVSVLGSFMGEVDFDPGAGIDSRTANGDSDSFLMQLDSNGSYDWANAFGSSWLDGGGHAIFDPASNLYYTGIFSGTVDFDPGPGVDNKTSNGDVDIFITKINNNGTYGWTRTFGGTGYDSAPMPAIDSAGNILLGGYFQSTVDFDPGPGTDSRTSAGINDIFLTALTDSGAYLWTKTMGASGWDSFHGLVVDSDGNIYLTGGFELTVDFDPGPETDYHTSAAEYDAFLTKLNPDWSYAWTKTWGSNGEDSGLDVRTDIAGNIYIAGGFNGTVDFDPGPGVDNQAGTTCGGCLNCYVSRFNADGSFGWARVFAGTGPWDACESVTIDGNGNVYITGGFNGTVDFDPGAGTDERTSLGEHDAFITRINAGGGYGWTKVYGSSGDERGYFIAMGEDGYLYIAGYFSGTIDFLGSGDYKTSSGGTDIFILKLYP